MSKVITYYPLCLGTARWWRDSTDVQRTVSSIRCWADILI